MTGPDVVRLLRLVLRGTRGFVTFAVAEDDHVEAAFVPAVGAAPVELLAHVATGPLGRRWAFAGSGRPLVLALDQADEVCAGLSVVVEGEGADADAE